MKQLDKNKIIQGLECCKWSEIIRQECDKIGECPYTNDGCQYALLNDIEQWFFPVSVTWQQGKAYCGECGCRIPVKIKAHYCHKCGRKIRWM